MSYQETNQEIIDIVGRLNEELYEQFESEWSILVYSFSGYVEAIEFLGCNIWCSEDDNRKYVDEESGERENLEVYLRKTINELINNLSKINL